MGVNATYAPYASIAINGSLVDQVTEATLTTVGTVSTGSDGDGDYIGVTAGGSNRVVAGVLPKVDRSTGGTWIYKLKTTGTSAASIFGVLQADNYIESLNLNSQGNLGTTSSGRAGIFLRKDNSNYVGTDANDSINDGNAHIVGIEYERNSSICNIWVDGVEITGGGFSLGTFDPATGDTAIPFFIFCRNNKGTADQPCGDTKLYSLIKLESDGFDLASLTTDMSPIFTTAADTTAPILTSATATATGATTASGSVTTDEGNGTLYSVATTSSTKPDKAQVKAGQDHTGSAASWGGSQAISSTGAKSVSVTGLTAETTYYLHHMQEDAATNQSDVASSSSFTTDAVSTFANTVSVSDPLKNNTGTVLASQTGIKVAVLAVADLSSVYEGTATTNASGILSDITDAAIVAGSYHVAIKLTDGSVGITGAIEAV